MTVLPGNDAVIAVAAIFFLLSAEAWVKHYRLRLQGAPLPQRREAIGTGVAGLAFSLLFAALTAFGLVVAGQTAFAWPQPRGWTDWLFLGIMLTPFIYLTLSLTRAILEAAETIHVQHQNRE